VNDVTGTIWVASGSGAASWKYADGNYGPINLPSGSGTTFTWQVTGLGNGTVWFTATAGGDDTGTTPNGVGVVDTWSGEAIGSLTISPLTPSLVVYPDPADVGGQIRIALTVTNNGASNVTTVFPYMSLNRGTAYVSYVSGPNPTDVSMIATGGSQTFEWIYQVTGGGYVEFTLTAMGMEGPQKVWGSGTEEVVGRWPTTCEVRPQIICTLAGNGNYGYNGNDIQATTAQISESFGVCEDSHGNVYYADAGSHIVRKIDRATGVVTTVVGNRSCGFNGDGILATSAQLCSPYDVEVDAAGNLYIADMNNNRIRMVDAQTGIISTVAGNGGSGSSGDGGPAVNANLSSPYGIGLDQSGNIYIADTFSHKIRKVTRTTGIIDTVAGNGFNGYGGDAGPALLATLNQPRDVAVTPSGDFYIADTENHAVRRVNAATGDIFAYAGTGASGYNGDGMLATAAWLYRPNGVAVDAGENVYIADTENSRVRLVNAATGFILTFAGTNKSEYNGDGIYAAGAGLYYPRRVSIAPSGNILIADSSNYRVREVGYGIMTLDSRLVAIPDSTIKGSGKVELHYTVTNTGGSSANGVTGRLWITAGEGLVAPDGVPNIGPVDLPSGSGTTFVWTFDTTGNGKVYFSATASGDDQVFQPNGAGVVDTYSLEATEVLSITPVQSLISITSNPTDTGQAVEVVLSVTDFGSSAVEVTPYLSVNRNGSKVSYVSGPSPAGPVTIPSGGSWQAFTWTYNTTGGGRIEFTATAVGVENPGGDPVLTASTGELFVRYPPLCQLDPGYICTIAGTGGYGWNGDGDPVQSQLSNPSGVARDSAGNIYIADSQNHRVRKIDAATRELVTVAGTGSKSYNGDGIPAVNAALMEPRGVAVDAAGNLYIAEYQGHRIRRVDAATKIISTVAGTGSWGSGGDTGLATAAQLANPHGVAVDSTGKIYIADSGNHKIRKVTGGIIDTIVGTGSAGYNSDGFGGTSRQLWSPMGVAVDSTGNVYIADNFNHRVRKYDQVGDQISTIAGDGTEGYNADDIPATTAWLNNPVGVAVAANGAVFVADRDNHRVRRFTEGGNIYTVAGTGSSAYNGDGILAINAHLYTPYGVAVDSVGNLYIAEEINQRIREVVGGLRTLSANLRVIPVATPVCAGCVRVEMTVTPVGGSGVDAVTGTLWITSGAVRVNQVVSANFGPVNLSAGSGTTFVWWFDALSYGSVQFSATASGDDLGNTPNGVGVVDTASNRPVATLDVTPLLAELTFSPPTGAQGYQFEERLKVTNIGGVAITDVTPNSTITSGATKVSLVSGPAPPTVASLDPGASATFIWRYTATATSFVYFSADASGVEGGSITVVSNQENKAIDLLNNPILPPSFVTASGWSRTIYLNWSNGSGGDYGTAGYFVYRSTGPEGPYIGIAGPSSNGYNDFPVTNGVSFWYKVATYDYRGHRSEFTATLTGTAFEPPAPYIVAWKTLPSLNAGRFGHALVAANDTLFAFGGEGTVGSLENSTETLPLFGPPSRGWYNRGSVGFVARRFFGAAEYNGDIYAVGGEDLTPALITEMQRYEMSTSMWVGQCASFEPCNTTFPQRKWFSMNSTGGELQVFGGFNAGYLDTFANLSVVAWSTYAGITKRADYALCRPSMGTFLIGGYDGTGFVTKVDELGLSVAHADLPSGRKALGGASLDYRPYAIGGFNGGAPIPLVQEYDPAMKTWTDRRSLPSARMNPQAVEYHKKIYVVGGETVAFGNGITDVLEGTPVEARGGNDKVYLQWGFAPGTYPIRGTDTYQVFRNTAGGSDNPSTWGPVIANISGVGSTLFTDTNVTNGNFYQYFVVAQDDHGNSGWAWDLIYLDASAPTNLLTRTGSGQVLLLWDPIANPAGENVYEYEVYRDINPGIASLPPDRLESFKKAGFNGSTSMYLDNDVVNGTTYFYVVKAKSAVTGPGAPSNEANGTPGFIAPPGTPQDLIVTSGLDQVVRLTWTVSCQGDREISGYYVYRATQPGVNMQATECIMRVNPSPGATVFFIVLDQDASGLHTITAVYKVQAYDTYDPPTVSPPTPAATAAIVRGYWRHGQGDTQGSRASQLATGWTNKVGIGWSLDIGSTVYGTPAIEYLNGNAYVACEDGKLRKVRQDGTIAWSAPFPGMSEGTESSPAIAYADLNATVSAVYVGSKDGAVGWLTRFNSTGGILWIKSMPGPVRSSPLLLPDGSIVVGDDSGTVRSFRPDGAVNWTVNLPGPVRGGIIHMPGRDGWDGEIGVLCGDWKIYGIYSMRGSVSGSIDLTGTPTGAVWDTNRSAMYVTSMDGRFTHFSFSNSGQPTVLFSATTAGSFAGPMSFHTWSNQVFMTNTDGKIYIYHLDTRQMDVMPIGSGAPMLSAPSVCQNTLLAGDESGNMFQAGPNIMTTRAMPEGGRFGTAGVAWWMDGGGKTTAIGGARNHRLYKFVEGPMHPGALSGISGSGKITLSWTSAGAGYFPVSRYEVFRATCVGCPFAYQATVHDPVYGTGYVDATVDTGPLYRYQVRTIDDSTFNNYSVDAGPVDVLYGPTPVPAALTVLAAGSRWLKLSWTPPVGGLGVVSAYTVYRSSGHDGPYKPLGIRVGYGTSVFVDAPVTNGVPLWYAVSAIRMDGDLGSFSATVTGTPFARPAPYIVGWMGNSESQETGRFAHGNTVIGDTAYILGGQASTGVVSTMESAGGPGYDFMKYRSLSYSGSFLGRAAFGAAVRQGMLYAVGGRTGSGVIMGGNPSLMQRFDPSISQWSDVPQAGFIAMEQAPALSVRDGDGLVTFGGYHAGVYYGNIQRFDFARSMWSTVNGFTARYDSAAANAGYTMFVMGGDTGDAAMPTNENVEFIPERNELAWRAPIPGDARWGAAAVEFGERIYLIGGANEKCPDCVLDEVLEYDPAADAWKTRRPTRPLTDPRAVTVDGHVYVTGGRTGVAAYEITRETRQGVPMLVDGYADKIGLTWGIDPGTYGLDHFVIYRTTYPTKDMAARGVPIDGAVAGTATSFVDDRITGGHKYCYYTDAYDSKGNMVTVWADGCAPITPPLNLTALPGSNSVLLRWEAPQNAVSQDINHYEIFRATFSYSGPEWKRYYHTCGGGGAGTLEYIDYGTVNGNYYSYVVVAMSNQGCDGLPSAETTATPFDIPAPTAPPGLVANGGLDQTAGLSWNASTPGGRPITGYRIYRTTTPSASPRMTGGLVSEIRLPQTLSLLDQAAVSAVSTTFYYSAVAFDDWTPPTYSAESAVVSAVPNAGMWRSGRADPAGTGASAGVTGLKTAPGIRWSFALSGSVYCIPVTDYVNGNAYFTTSQGILYKVKADGTLGWQVPAFDGYGTEGSPAIVYADTAGTVDFVVAVGKRVDGNNVRAYSDATGLLKWAAQMPSAIRATPAIMPNGDIVAADDGGHVRRYAKDDGRIVWTETLPGGVRGSVAFAVSQKDNVIFVVTADSKLYGLSIENGTVSGWIDLPAVPNNAIYDELRDQFYVGCDNGTVYAVNGGEYGGLMWSRTLGGSIVSAPAMEWNGSFMLAASTNGTIAGIDPRTGGNQGGGNQAPIRGGIAFSANGNAYWTNEQGIFFAATGGEAQWCQTPEAAPFGTSGPALWQDASGRFQAYAGSGAQKLYAFVDAPDRPGPLSAIAVAGRVDLTWTVAGAGYFPVSGYRIFRTTCAKDCPLTEVGFTIGVYATAYSDSSVAPNTLYYYGVKGVDDTPFNNPGLWSQEPCNVNTVGPAPCAPNVTMRVKTPDPLYVNGGDSQLWRLSFSNSGTDTVYNVTVTTGTDSFKYRVYEGPSASATVYGGALVSVAWFNGSSWVAGEPPDGTSEPQTLRFVLSNIPPGRSASVSFRVRAIGGGDQLLDCFISATMSCDPGGYSAGLLDYSATGTGKRIQPPLLWVRLHDSGMELDDLGGKMARDGSGNYYAVAHVNQSGINQADDWLIRKYNSSGNTVWSRSFTGAGGGNDWPQSVVVNPVNGSIAVCGSETMAGQGLNWLVIKYAPDGTLMWSRSYVGPTPNGPDAASAVAFDQDGNLYAGGLEDRSIYSEGANWLLIKYDPAGTVVWSRSFTGPGNQMDMLNGLAVDHAGYVYAAGQEGRADLGQANNWRVIKYAPDGTVVWTRSYSGPGSNMDAATSVAIDGNDNAIVAGYVSVTGQAENWHIRKYDSDGNLLWSREYNSPANNDDRINQVAVDADGSVVAAGRESRSDFGQLENWLIQKYDAAGNFKESLTHDGLVNSSDILNGIALSADGLTAVVTGSETVRGQGADFAVARYQVTEFHAPEIPGLLTAHAQYQAIQLGWAVSAQGPPPSNAVQGYRIFRTTFNGFIPSENNWIGNIADAATTWYVDSSINIGARYYYQVRAIDNQGVESLNSNEAWGETTIVLEITITSSTSYDFGFMVSGTPKVSTTTYDLVNSGNVAESLKFSLSNTGGTWIPVITGAPAFNEFELDAQFNFPDTPALWDPAKHGLQAAPPGPDLSGGIGLRFAGNETGLSVPVGDARHLWLRLIPPFSTNDPTRQKFTINIAAQAP
jgi:fibronectin type 3 domain-containing protein